MKFFLLVYVRYIDHFLEHTPPMTVAGEKKIGWLLTNASYRHVMLSKGPPLQAFVSHFSSPLLLPIRAAKARAIATWGNLKQHGSELINNKESFKNSHI